MISIVCLTINDPKMVKRCLSRQTYKDFELIIASEKGIVNAMNLALDRAKGEIFVRIDDDVHIPRKWLQRLVEPFSDPFVGGVTGPTFIAQKLRKNRDSIRFAENPGKFLRWLYDNNEFKPASIRECGCVSYDSNYRERFFDELEWFKDYEPDHLEGTNWAMRTDLIRKVGGFDPKFDGVAEWFDDDAVFKIKKLGYKLVYNPKAYLFHKIEPSNATFHERFDGFGRIKNFLRFHWRHCRWRFLKLRFYAYLLVWWGYFVWRRYRR